MRLNLPRSAVASRVQRNPGGVGTAAREEELDRAIGRECLERLARDLKEEARRSATEVLLLSEVADLPQHV